MEVDETSWVARKVYKENEIGDFIAPKSCRLSTFCASILPFLHFRLWRLFTRETGFGAAGLTSQTRVVYLLWFGVKEKVLCSYCEDNQNGILFFVFGFVPKSGKKRSELLKFDKLFLLHRWKNHTRKWMIHTWCKNCYNQEHNNSLAWQEQNGAKTNTLIPLPSLPSVGGIGERRWICVKGKFCFFSSINSYDTKKNWIKIRYLNLHQFKILNPLPHFPLIFFRHFWKLAKGSWTGTFTLNLVRYMLRFRITSMYC